MTTVNKTANAFAFTGAGKARRTTASMQIAPLSFAEDTSRTASLANMRIVLGNSPSDELSKAAKAQWVIGRVASRLPFGELPKGKTSQDDRLTFARGVVLHMARAPQEGRAVRPLRKGQIARRSVMQQKVVRAAEEAASLFWADLGLSNARTMKEKTAKAATAKRAPSMAGSGKGKKGSATPPTHAELVKPAAPMSQTDAIAYLLTQSSALQAFANKHAAMVPTDAGTAVSVFRKAMLAAANTHETRKAIAAAAKADKPANVTPIKAKANA